MALPPGTISWSAECDWVVPAHTHLLFENLTKRSLDNYKKVAAKKHCILHKLNDFNKFNDKLRIKGDSNPNY